MTRATTREQVDASRFEVPSSFFDMTAGDIRCVREAGGHLQALNPTPHTLKPNPQTLTLSIEK